MAYIPVTKTQALILQILEIATIYNAVYLGWNVRQIGSHKYELSKNIDEKDFNLDIFINRIVYDTN